MEGEDIKGLGDKGKDAKANQVFLDVSCIEQAHRQAVCKNREGQSANPAENRILRKESGTHMVNEHGNDGNQFKKISIQVGFKLWLGGLFT